MSYYVYEPQYKLSGWADDSGMTQDSWFDRDLTSNSTGAMISLVRLEPRLWANPNTIFTLPPLTYEVLPGFLVNQQIFFDLTAVSRLDVPDELIKNEVRRV